VGGGQIFAFSVEALVHARSSTIALQACDVGNTVTGETPQRVHLPPRMLASKVGSQAERSIDLDTCLPRLPSSNMGRGGHSPGVEASSIVHWREGSTRLVNEDVAFPSHCS